MGNVLQHYGLTGTRRRHDQPALSFALRCHQIDDAGGIVLVAANDVEIKFLGRIKRGQVVKIDSQFGFFGVVKIDTVDFGEGKITFVVFRRADFAFDGIAGAQSKFFNLGRRNVNVVGTGQIV